jgi:hypothetical protein
MFLVSNTAIVKEGMKSGIRLDSCFKLRIQRFSSAFHALDYVASFR